MSRILFLTFNDAPSGIYAGQVSGVCHFLKQDLGHEVLLCAFLSLRGFSENASKVNASFFNTAPVRMFPRARNWRMNRFTLRRIVKRFRPDTIIARGPFAANLALDLRDQKIVQRVVFDGRGAYVAELHEYNVVPDEQVKNEIAALEKRAVLDSDYRIAVSDQLVHYWRKEFHYALSMHEIIPCTLSEPVAGEPSATSVANSRAQIGAADDDVVIAYSGSAAGWQSLGEAEIFSRILEKQNNIRFLFLTQQLPGGDLLPSRFGNRIIQRWVKPSEVSSILCAADYGWMIREKSITNRVASPVKFAEYLAAGLDVIISPELGDYSDLVSQNFPGSFVLDAGADLPLLKPKSIGERKMLHHYALEHFTKSVYRDAYQRLCP